MVNFNQLYSPKVMQHFMHPKNIGIIKDADGVGTVGNPRCGDVMKVYIKVKNPPTLRSEPRHRVVGEKSKGKNQEIIQDIKVQTLGCGAAIATSSMATEMVKGKPVDEALKLSRQAIAEALGGLPPVKIHCSVLAAEGIKKAIEDYRRK